MKKTIFFIIMFMCNITYSNNKKLDQWILPDPSRHYHETVFLTAHNAYSNITNGYIQPQQLWDIKKQLEMGIRGFMLDTHYSGSKNKNQKNKILLCHRNYVLTKMLLKPFKGEPESFNNSLKIIKEFLVNNPKEIITIFLENYTNGQDLDKAIKHVKLEDIILKPSDWDSEKNYGWPTLQWMQENNKRLVLFNQKGQTKYIFDEWSCHAENQWGELFFKSAIKERYESLAAAKYKRYLFVLNYFPKFYIKKIQNINFKKINSEDLLNFFNYYLTNGLGNKHNYKNRYPNFIAIDFVNEGNAINLINQINTMANNPILRKKMFHVLKD